jgi:ribosomal protein S18 acetylase RimI-like enzyme
MAGSGSAEADVIAVRRAGVEDAPEVARLLHDFNTEFDSPTPGVAALTERARELIGNGEVTVLLGGEEPVGIAVLRFRPSLWATALDAYLEELYVAPDRRGEGIGRALLETVLETARVAGAARIELGTSDDDEAAIALYERFGFTNREGGPDGPLMRFYERDL